MCGITGIIAFNEKGKQYHNKVELAATTLALRGPDSDGIYKHNNVALGHTRLAVIDTSDKASQPFTDITGRYTIIFNGEFYNYNEHRKALIQKGIKFQSNSDTEVLLYLYINNGPSCLEKVNGCFAFAIYDKVEETLFIARDRIGIKPLIIYQDEDKLIFASEMKALLAYNIPKIIDIVSLFNYLQFNYIPAPYSIFQNVTKLTPGSYLLIKNNKVINKQYYTIPYSQELQTNLTYKEAQKQLINILDRAVQLRLVSDVPLGAFLSGGIDSSIIVALASKYIKQLNTFSIGYKDEPFFDETHYAELVANKYKTNHTVFSLSNDDLYANLHKVLEYTDEPFADSSALAVHILSMHTRKNVTVALSGDGADEMFAGYNKHNAHYQAIHSQISSSLIKWASPLWEVLPQSRNNKAGNIIRQLNRFAKGLKLSDKDRYWQWCSFIDEKQALNILAQRLYISFQNQKSDYNERKKLIVQNISNKSSITELLYSDMSMVLPNDMLTKVDLMSMANSLEVRTPFLDHNVVNFAFTLPDSYKIDRYKKKKILQDAFRSYLPEKLYNRHKHGFEVPLRKWFRSELKSLITDDLLNDNFIQEQNIFSISTIRQLKSKLFSKYPEDVETQIWGLIVFQYWWKKYFY